MLLFLGRDLRRAARSLRRSPAFTVLAVLLVGTGLAVVTGVSGILDAVVHPTTPYADPDRLLVGSFRNYAPSSRASSFELFRALADEAGQGARRAALASRSRAIVSMGAESEDVTVAAVSPGYFAVLGARPSEGRLLTASPASDEWEAAVVSEDLWRRLRGGGGWEAGAQVTVGERIYHVVGLAPRELAVVEGARVWTPIAPARLAGASGLERSRVYVRVADGSSVRSELARIAALWSVHLARLGDARFDFFEWRNGHVDPLGIQPVHSALAGVALAIWLIAVANVAMIMAARGMSRRRTFAVEMALGASRGAVVREMVAEATLISVGGTVFGVLASTLLLDVIGDGTPAELRVLGILSPQLSLRVLALSALVGAASAALSGVIPALRVSALNPSESLRANGSASSRGHRDFSRGFVIGQVALAVVLAVGATLLARTAARVGAFEFGFATEHLVEAGLPMPAESGAAASRGEVQRFQDQLLSGVTTVRGVREAALWTVVSPAQGHVSSDEPGPGGLAQLPLASYVVATPGFLRALRVSVRRGRDFEPSDGLWGGAAVVDQETAANLWPSGRAVGGRLEIGPGRWVTVVGVIPRVSLAFIRDADAPRPPVIVCVLPSEGAPLPFERLLVRLDARRPAEATVALQGFLRGLSPGGTSGRVRPWAAEFEKFLAGRRYLASVLGLAAGLGVVLSAVGLYGGISRSVTRRLREYGIRIALGASPRAVAIGVLRDVARIVFPGVAAGAVLAVLTVEVLESLLYGVAAFDAFAFGAGGVAVLAAAVVAAVEPAIRASHADPSVLLRSDC